MLTIQQKSTHARSTLFLLVALLAFAAALAARPAAGLAAPGPLPQLSFQPDSYDFGLQPLNWGTTQTNFELRNEGTEPVSTENVDITGSGSYAFWTGPHNCGWTTLQPGSSCWVPVYFGPQDMAEYEASLRVGAEGQSFSAVLSGTGGRAAFVPDSEISDFGSAAVGSEGVTREIEISNAGNMAGGLFIAVIAGGAIGSFQLLDENCTGFALNPGATCTLQVRFRPLSEGVKTARVGLFGESDGGTQILVTGVGAAPVDEAESQGSAAGSPAGSVTSVVNTTTHRIIRRVAKAPKRKPNRVRGIRHHRRAGLEAAKRIVTAPVGG